MDEREDRLAAIKRAIEKERGAGKYESEKTPKEYRESE